MWVVVLCGVLWCVCFFLNRAQKNQQSLNWSDNKTLVRSHLEICSFWKLNVQPTLNCKFCLSFNSLISVICYAGIRPNILFRNITDLQTASRKQKKSFVAVQNRTYGWFDGQIDLKCYQRSTHKSSAWNVCINWRSVYI